MKVSLIVPCYNEEKNVETFYNTVIQSFKNHISDYEIIFINDGSLDGTYQKLKALYKTADNVKVVNFSRNFGKESAMYAGLQKAKGDYITIIDADLQQNPNLVIKMVDFLEQNQEYDSVAMYQESRNESKVLSFFKTGFYKIINSVCEIDFRSGASDFRTFRHYVVDAILKIKEYHRFSKGIFSWVGFNTYYMPYVANERYAGKSSWSFKKLLKYAIEGITAFTTFPLKLSTYIGIISSVFSLIYMVVIIVQKLFYGINIPGYATLVVLILLIGGIQLLALGVIGQYLSKMYIQGKHRPIFIEKEYLDKEVK